MGWSEQQYQKFHRTSLSSVISIGQTTVTREFVSLPSKFAKATFFVTHCKIYQPKGCETFGTFVRSNPIFSESISPQALFASCDHVILACCQIIQAERPFGSPLFSAEKFDVIKRSQLVNQAATCMDVGLALVGVEELVYV
jgi:hypothetical protein